MSTRPELVSRWKEVVRDEIWKVTESKPGSSFSRQGLLKASLPRLQAEFPDARTPEQTLSRELQELRDTGEIEFLEPGRYRLLVGDKEALRQLHDDLDHPGTRPGTRTVRRGEIRTRPYQAWIRSRVLPNFEHSCAVCGLSPEWFLDAAHLRPASRFLDLAGDPTAVIALCRNHHRAMDRGAFVINEDLTISVRSGRTTVNDEYRRVIEAFDGEFITRPQKWPLNKEALPSVPLRPISR